MAVLSSSDSEYDEIQAETSSCIRNKKEKEKDYESESQSEEEEEEEEEETHDNPLSVDIQDSFWQQLRRLSLEDPSINEYLPPTLRMARLSLQC